LSKAVKLLEDQEGLIAVLLRPQVLVALAWVLRTMGDFEACLSVARRCREEASPTVRTTVASLALMARAHWSLNHVVDARRCVDDARVELDRATERFPRTSANWFALAQ